MSKQQGRIQEYFKGGSKLWSERTAELFCGKLLTSHKKRPSVFQFVNVGAGNFALRAVHKMVAKNNYFLIPLENFALRTDRRRVLFLISLEYSLVAKCNARFIEEKSAR